MNCLESNNRLLTNAVSGNVELFSLEDHVA
jgi:hypothetical protein